MASGEGSAHLILSLSHCVYDACMDLARRAKIGRRLEWRERVVGLWLTRLISFLSLLEFAAVLQALHR